MPSLNITAGYRLPEEVHLPSLAEQLRTMAAPVRDKVELAEVARYCSDIIDRADLAGEPRPAMVVFDAVREHTEHITSILDGSHDCHERGVRFGVLDDPATGRLYLTMSSQEKAYREAFDDGGFAEYFPYWDHDDRPYGVSSAEWAERGKIWRRVLLDNRGEHPREEFSLHLGGIRLPEVDLVNRSRDILATMPTLEQRVHTHIQTIIGDWHDEQLPPDEVARRIQTVIPGEGQKAVDAFKPITLADLTGEAS